MPCRAAARARMAATSLYPFGWLGRSRASLPKVKTGCVSCKKRRVKCDEGKPVCNRCQKGFRVCAYQNPKAAVLEDASLQIRLCYSEPHLPLDEKRFASEVERYCFDNFLQLPAQALGDGLGWRDWPSVVLQNSEHNGALRHAVTAFTALHMEKSRSRGHAIAEDLPLLPLAYKQYYEAIRQLRTQLQHHSTTSIEANMLACMILVIFDFVQGNYRAAGTHFFGGVAILRSYLNERSSSEGLITRISAPWRTSFDRSGISSTQGSFGARLLLSYGYLDYWSACCIDSLPALPEVSVLEGLAVSPPPGVDDELENLFQAFAPLENRIREFLRAATGLLYRHGHQVPPTDLRRLLPHQTSSACFEDIKRELTEDLADWEQDHHRISATCLYNEPRQVLALGRWAANHRKLSIMLAAVQSDGSCNYRAYTSDFKEVLTLARRIFEGAENPYSLPYYPETPFVFGVGIIHPLYITALHCCDIGVCQEAIGMLAARHWNESAWDSFEMARLAREQLENRKQRAVPHGNALADTNTFMLQSSHL